jgi:hypothetical protein
MTPIIRAVLSNLVGDEDAKDIDIISNDVIIHPDGKWDIKYRHPTRCDWFYLVHVEDMIHRMVAAITGMINHRQFFHTRPFRTLLFCFSSETVYRVRCHCNQFLVEWCLPLSLGVWLH